MSATAVTPDQKAAAKRVFRRMRTDFPYYAERCLKITTKDGKLLPLQLNRAQLHIHAKIEEQRQKIGRVRALILKGRQQGASTYIGARFYWKSSGERGKKVQILTHEIPATQNLFRMTKRYHEHCPPEFKPSAGAVSTIELWFDKLDTRYALATAGTQATGRSGTVQYMHGSEMAFWQNASDHLAGIGQNVPEAAGTEIIYESTANGIGNPFHSMCMDALRGHGDFILIFVPWFWEEGYRRPIDVGFTLDDDELKYQAMHGCDDEQMAWRRAKIIDSFRGDEKLFNQEYPATIQMAFEAGSKGALIAPSLVLEAFRRVKPGGVGPLIMSLDPAEYGEDDSVFGRRRGRIMYPFEAFHGRGPMELAGLAAERLEKYEPDAFCVDVSGGYGMGIIERLAELKFKNLYAINFGEAALEPEIYANRRAEMWCLMRDWLRDMQPHMAEEEYQDGKLVKEGPAASEISSVTYRYDSSRRVILTSKEKMREDGIPSPDRGDAAALTFAVRVAQRGQQERPNWRKRLEAQRRKRSGMAA